jgi:HEAT repeat protein
MALGMMDLADRDIPKVVEALVRRISSEPQAVVRYQAMISLSRFQPIDAKAAIAPLAKEVEDQNTWEIRKLAVSLLTSLGYDDQKGPDPIAMRGLITALKDPAIQVKQEAVFGLATIGRPADQALATNVKGAFTTLINNSDKGIAIWANVGLINLEKPDGKLLANITKHLSDPRADVRVLAARALGTLGKLAEFTIPELTKALTDPEPEVQVMAIWALAMMGSSGSKALPNLRELADNKKTLESVKQSALMAIGQISGKPDGTLAPKILTPKDGKAPGKGS